MPLAIALWGDAKVTALIGGSLSPKEVEQRLLQEVAGMQTHRVQYWPIFLLATGDHAGCAGLRPYRAEQQIYELGFHLRPEHWGYGLAEEAARAVIAYAFQTLIASALFAGHHPQNAASRRILAKLGFRHTHDELYPPTGLHHQSYLLERSPR